MAEWYFGLYNFLGNEVVESIVGVSVMVMVCGILSLIIMGMVMER